MSMRSLREGYLSTHQKQEGVRELINDVYVVKVERASASREEALWLTIRRRDRQSPNSQGDLQWIKTQIAGESAVGVQFVLAETGDQQHCEMLVFADANSPMLRGLMALLTNRQAARKKAERGTFAFTF